MVDIGCGARITKVVAILKSFKFNYMTKSNLIELFTMKLQFVFQFSGARMACLMIHKLLQVSLF